MRLILAITGASGTNLAKKFIKYLPNHIELHIITSKHAKIVEAYEEKKSHSIVIKI
jgi:3-polyprenyl-4-hydroxybenzoate decarboxylase